MSNGKNRPKIFFKLSDSTIMSMFKSVLYSKKEIINCDEDILKLVKNIKLDDMWCIILVAAGHFAAAVFKGDQVVVHKTFHRYVVRAKRGGVQSQHDASGKHAKSAGANIRRSQEAAFKEDIKSLIGTEWKNEISQCKSIFIRVPQYNRSVLISTGPNTAPFDKNDQRLRTIPFMTFRPTFNEVKRAHNLLARVEQFDSDYLEVLTKFEKKVIESHKQDKSKPKPKPKKNKSSPNTSKSEDLDTSIKFVEEPLKPIKKLENDEYIQSLSGDNLKLFNDIYTSCMTNNVTKLTELLNPKLVENNKDLEDYKLSIEKIINKRLNKQNGFTLLHLCSQMGFGECVWQLLLNGADPTITDLSKNKILPYFVSQNKSIRDMYRRFMHDFPNRYNYELAKINDPLSSEKIQEKLDKEREKKKLKKQAKKERDALVKEKLNQQEIEDNERKLFLSLSDQEKRMLVVDRNFLNLMPKNDNDQLDSLTQAKYSPQKIRIISRCWYCGIDMSSSVPFEYFDYKFCSTKCLKSHRQQQQELKNAAIRPKLTS
ncbi:unnamed protein product [Brachionus calyciflorus]|uniref:VLRF1 domain-containing protein n=1 Tax=Brachionus calyciflorus TaxID=104777 RepID=A0A814BUD1_9BILA|nr:unnamed protein product [Brachionus calyciflorus]